MSRIEVTFLGAEHDSSVVWAHYIAAHPDATVYHSLAWRAIFEHSFGYRSWLLLARDSSSGAVNGILPLYLVTSPFARRLVAVPFRDRGGPLWDSIDALNELISRAQSLAAETGADALILKTIRPLPAEVAAIHGLVRHDHWVHSMLDLTGITEESLWHRIGPKTRNMIRQAQRNGLEGRVVIPDDSTVERWHRLHIITQKRLGIPPFPLHFFSAMARKLRSTGNIELVEVCRGNKACAATILLINRNVCIYGYSASSNEGQHLRANDLMLHSALKLALDRGLASFDFGSDSPTQQSLIFFKRKWGATQAKIPTYISGAGAALNDSSDRCYALARSVLHRMPNVVLRHLVSRFTRYFG